MGQIKVKADSVLDAPSADVYATIADYRQGHPAILPQENFYDLQVEHGGYGDGTIIRFKTKILGVVRDMYQRVSELEPGRVLVEQHIDIPQKLATTFTGTTVRTGKRPPSRFSTTVDTRPGRPGIVDRRIISL